MRTHRGAGRKGTRLVVGLWAVVAALLVLVLVGAARGAGPDGARTTCTHGASSLGPLEIANGKVVGGSATPHTEPCRR